MSPLLDSTGPWFLATQDHSIIMLELDHSIGTNKILVCMPTVAVTAAVSWSREERG